MKTFLLLICFSITAILRSQTYKFSGFEVENRSPKNQSGDIIITDTTVTFIFGSDTTGKPLRHKISKRSGDKIYFNDGKLNHSLLIVERKGRNEGVKFNRLIFCYMDFGQGKPVEIKYYCWLDE